MGQGIWKMSAGGRATENHTEFYRELFLVRLKRVLGIRLVKNLNEVRSEIDQPKRLILKGY